MTIQILTRDNEGMKRRSKLIGKAFCCCEVTVGFSSDGRGNRTPRPELRRCGRKTLRPHTPSYLAPLRRGLFSCAFRALPAGQTSSYSRSIGTTNSIGPIERCAWR